MSDHPNTTPTENLAPEILNPEKLTADVTAPPAAAAELNQAAAAIAAAPPADDLHVLDHSAAPWEPDPAADEIARTNDDLRALEHTVVTLALAKRRKTGGLPDGFTVADANRAQDLLLALIDEARGVDPDAARPASALERSLCAAVGPAACERVAAITDECAEVLRNVAHSLIAGGRDCEGQNLASCCNLIEGIARRVRILG